MWARLIKRTQFFVSHTTRARLKRRWWVIGEDCLFHNSESSQIIAWGRALFGKPNLFLFNVISLDFAWILQYRTRNNFLINILLNSQYSFLQKKTFTISRLLINFKKRVTAAYRLIYWINTGSHSYRIVKNSIFNYHEFNLEDDVARNWSI